MRRPADLSTLRVASETPPSELAAQFEVRYTRILDPDGRPRAPLPEPFSDPRALDAAVHELDDTMGLHRLRLLHVNDSKTPLGSNVDRHDYVGQGLIGEGLATFLGHPAFADLPAIVETWVDRGHETEDLDRMRELRRKGARRWSRAKARALGPDGLSPRR